MSRQRMYWSLIPFAWFAASIAVLAFSATRDVLAASTAPNASPGRGAIDEKTNQLLDQFLADCGKDAALSDGDREKIASAVAAARQDPATKRQAITQALAQVNPELRQAVVALADEETDAAVTQLQKLAQSDNPYLAAEASFYLGRAYVTLDRHEEAAALLANITSGKLADRALQSGEAWFYLGVAENGLLNRQGASQSFAKFLAAAPDAPERLRVGAIHELEEIKTLEEGSILDVEERMEYSRRRLALEQSDQPTQTQQKTIVSMLDKLIEEAEEKENSECHGNCKGGGKCKGKGKKPGGGGGKNPAGGAARSNAPVGESKVGALHGAGRGGEQSWGGLKDKERNEVLESLKTKFPERYQQLLEQYYKSLQDEDR